MRSRRPLFCFLAASLCCLPAGNTQTLIPSTPQQQHMRQLDGLEEAKLLTPTEGWARSDKQLMFTTDQGATWKNITPTGGGADFTIAQVVFTAPTQGWVLRQKQDMEADSWTLLLSSTADQGATWQNLPVTNIPKAILQSYSGLGGMQFVDPQHGWLALRRVSSVGFSEGHLFQTTDGGESWHELPEPPIYAVPKFEQDGTGYLIGGASGHEAYKTWDGGQTWAELNIPSPPGEYEPQGLSDLRVEGQQITLLRTIRPTEGNESIEVLRSLDGGVTWSGAKGAPALPSSVSSAAITMRGVTTVQAFRAEHNGRIVFGEGRGLHAAALPSTWAQSEVNVLDLSFPNAQVGWMKVDKTDCKNKECTAGTYLLRTSDGGHTFQEASIPFRTTFTDVRHPRAAPSNRKLSPSESNETTLRSDSRASSLYASVQTGQGFDSYDVPPVSLLKAWSDFNSDVSEGVGFYLGGANHSKPTVSKAWVHNANCWQYAMLPLWVGPQSPGTNCKNCSQFTADLDGARQAGTAESGKAVVAMQALGLPTGIVYYDLENYSTLFTGADNAFVEGWVTGMHAAGFDAGVYGSPYMRLTGLFKMRRMMFG